MENGKPKSTISESSIINYPLSIIKTMLEGLDHSILLGFIEEAQSYTPNVRQGIAEFQLDANRLDAIQQAHRHIHTIRGAALMIGMDELSILAGEMEFTLEAFIGGAGSLAPTKAAVLLEQLTHLEGLLAVTAGIFRDVIAEEEGELGSWGNEELETEDCYDDSFSPSSVPFSLSAESDDEVDEVDPEMLEVFTLEAEEHLQNISANLQILQHNPHHREALNSIRRSAHTLKGAAGVVGFKTTTRLAHRMEDLLDRLAEQPLHSTPQTTALLLASTDALEALSRGATRQTIKIELDKLYSRYDVIMTTGDVTAVEDALSAAEITSETEVSAAQTIAQTMSEVLPIAAPAAVEPKPETVNAAAPTRTVVRVELGRLDEMVKLMGEMVISRTVLEQRLKNIESQLGEMQLSTGRLRRIANKLEIDYEAIALEGGRSGMGKSVFAPVFLQTAPAPVIDFENNGATNKHGFDDLEFDRYTEFHQLTRELVETSTDTSSITTELDDLLGDLESLLTRQRRLSDELQEKMMRLRMVPLGSITTRLQRTVSVTADAEGKSVDLEIEGENVEIDTQVLTALAEPLLHLIRNSVVHGIEKSEAREIIEKPLRGLIKLRAYHEGTHVVLSITDDGRGMNPRALREKAVRENFISQAEAAALNDEQALSLVFLPGFSTAGHLSEIAGRGVGMDIVRESVRRQQGTISLKSVLGKGTTISIRLPMSMAVTRSLIVRAHGRRFALPLNMVLQLAQVSSEDFDQLTEEKILWVGGKFYPVHALNELLELPPPAERDETRIPTLLVNAGDTTIALTLDEVVEAREIVIKPLEKQVREMTGLVGATILGDGSVVPILDLLALVNRSVKTSAQQQTPAEAVKPPKAALSIMIVDDSPSVRRVMSNFVTKAGMNPITAKDGLEAVEILQLARELPDVILSDVEMPRMDGYELLSTLKRNALFGHIPIVMITSRAGDKHRQRALELGADDYVTKPYQDSVLLDTIKYLAGETV